MNGLRVYVGGLPQNTTEQDLEKFFEGFGKVTEIIIRKRFAFVEFDDKKHAEDAIFEMDGEELLGVRVTVKMARTTTTDRYHCSTSSDNIDNVSAGKKNGPLRTEYRVIVQNLSPSVSWQLLKDHMRKAAPVTYADVDRLLPDEGIVEFASYSGMKVAIEKLDGTELHGRQIRLVEDVKTTDDCLSASCRSPADSDSSDGGSCIESRSVTLSPYSDGESSRSHSRSRSRSGSRTLSAYSDVSSDTCFSSRQRCVSVCSDSSYSVPRSRSGSRTISAYGDIQCFRSRSQSLPGHGDSTFGSRSGTLSACSDISSSMACFASRSGSLSAFSDGSRSRTLSADSTGSRSRSPRRSRPLRRIGPRTPPTCSSRNRSRSQSMSRSELDRDRSGLESCRPSRYSSFFLVDGSRSRPGSANEFRSKFRKIARKRPGPRAHSAIPAKRILLDEIL